MFDEEKSVRMTVYAKDYTEAKFAERCLGTMIDLIYDKWEEAASKGWGSPDEELLMVCRVFDPIGYDEQSSIIADIKREKSMEVGK